MIKASTQDSYDRSERTGVYGRGRALCAKKRAFSLVYTRDQKYNIMKQLKLKLVESHAVCPY